MNDVTLDLDTTIEALNDYQSEQEALEHLIERESYPHPYDDISPSNVYRRQVSMVLNTYRIARRHALPTIEVPRNGKWRLA